MKHFPTLYRWDTIKASKYAVWTVLPDGRWTEKRPEGFPSFRHRLAVAWEVFRGRADAIVWPEDYDKVKRRKMV